MKDQPDKWGGVIDACVFIGFFGGLFVLLLVAAVWELA